MTFVYMIEHIIFPIFIIISALTFLWMWASAKWMKWKVRKRKERLAEEAKGSYLD